jgi:hypothetical protein
MILEASLFQIGEPTGGLNIKIFDLVTFYTSGT